MLKAWAMTFIDRHFGDFVAIFLLGFGAYLISHCSDMSNAAMCVHVGESLVGAGLATLRLKSGNGVNPPDPNGEKKQ